jgi:hypothetical protein
MNLLSRRYIKWSMSYHSNKDIRSEFMTRSWDLKLKNKIVLHVAHLVTQEDVMRVIFEIIFYRFD